MQPALIIVLCVVAAVTYGIAHDQITARLCVEYFTVGHDPTVIPTDDPTLLGLGWGILATWWVGMGLGMALAVAARARPGRRAPRSAAELVRPVVFLMLVAGVFALLAGLLGHQLGRGRVIVAVPYGMNHLLPASIHARFQACAFAHSASYWVGFVGGGVQVGRVWAGRRRVTTRPSLP